MKQFPVGNFFGWECQLISRGRDEGKKNRHKRTALLRRRASLHDSVEVNCYLECRYMNVAGADSLN